MLAVQINSEGTIPSLNSSKTDRNLARMLSNPEFRGLGVTLREFKRVYGEICATALATQMQLRGNK